MVMILNFGGEDGNFDTRSTLNFNLNDIKAGHYSCKGIMVIYSAFLRSCRNHSADFASSYLEK